MKLMMNGYDKSIRYLLTAAHVEMFLVGDVPHSPSLLRFHNNILKYNWMKGYAGFMIQSLHAN